MFKELQTKWLAVTGIVLGISTYLYWQWEYLIWSLPVLLIMVCLPFIFQKQGGKPHWEYPVLAFLLLLASYHFQLSSLGYFGVGLSLLYWAEVHWGRLNRLPLLALLAISPLFTVISNTWSFPIRLWLSKATAYLLSTLGIDVIAEGNLITLNGFQLSVDPACMGLRLLGTALVLAIIILAYYERKYNHVLTFLELSLATILVLLLAVAANFTRILVLVFFKILPENIFHDLFGLAAVVVYVLLPLYFLLGWYLKGYAQKEQINEQKGIAFSSTFALLTGGLLLIGIIVTSRRLASPREIRADHRLEIQVEGYQRTELAGGILKFDREGELIYLKPQVNPMRGAHDPRICWQGSGYDFETVRKQDLEYGEVYQAILVNDQDTIYSAWWYTDGQHVTTGEWDWRSNTILNGTSYYMVNVNVSDSEKLEDIRNFWMTSPW